MTIKDVAAYCGVAVSTVSRVLNNHPDVSPKTRAKVLEAVRELNFVPNNTARDLAATPSDAIGLVVRGVGNPFYTPVIQAIAAAAEKAGFVLALHEIPSGAGEVEEAASLVRAKRLRGVIFLGGRFDYTQAEGASLGVPFVCCTNTNDFGDLPKDAFSTVSIDDVQVGYDATRYLLSMGHRRIAILLDSDCDRSISQLRLSGYRKALQEEGIDPVDDLVLQTVTFTMEAAYKRVAHALASSHDFTAIFAVADTMALAAMKAVHDAGLQVPNDMSVLAVDGIDLSLYSIPTLSTYVQPQEALGRRAAEALIAVLRGEDVHVHERLATTLRVGGTVARAGVA